MFTSFSTALSALNAQSTAIDVVGNNLANLNTPGYKTSEVSFHDLVTQSLGAGLGDTQVGFGVGPPVTLREFSQGAIQTTNNPLDCAIQGDGFLVAKTTNGQTVYTRGGSLQVDKNGLLITSTGEHVEGWAAVNGAIDTNGPVGDITVPIGTVKAPTATQNFSFDMNLNASASAGPPADQFSTSLDVYDSLGSAHTVTATFTKSATANQWDYSVTCPDGAVTMTPATGSLTFSSSGVLTSPAATDTMPNIAITGLADGAADLNLNWQMYNGTTPRITQFSQASGVSANTQDGSAAAQLVHVGLGNGGTILAQYSNGTQSVVGQIAMASIRNPESMIAVGDNNYQTSARTALPAIGTPGTAGRGTILGGAVEASTVDVATEFTDLIVFQRGYQANAKIITTVDQMSQETINLKQD